ncbi:MAG: sulfotransferase [Acidimicrobiia bacterium]|nr:sulfotransferase [Acidimicrobiia bacterium]
MSDSRVSDLLILGAMRSGSTSLYRYLGAHPDIYLAPKELGFFTNHFDQGLDWYREQFAGRTEAVVGEATADYLARPSAMRRIVTTLPHAKLVASLREPVARAFSHHGLLSTRGVDKRSFAEAIDEELAAVAEHGPDAEGVFYLSHGLYDVHLRRWFDLVDRDRLQLVVFDDLRGAPQKVYQDLCRHLGVADTEVPDIVGEAVNPYVTFRSIPLRKLSQRMPRPMGRAIARLNTRQNAARPEMSLGTKAKLVDFYRQRIDAVEALTGLDLSRWKD